MSGLFGGGGGQSTSEKRLNAIQLQQSAYGNAVPLVYGKLRASPILVWYGSFTATAHTTSQGGKGGGGGATSTSYTYSAAMVLALAEGPITSVGNVWADKSQNSLSSLGFTLFTGAGPQATWSYLTTNYPTQAIPYDNTAYVAASSLQLGSSAALPNLSFEVLGLFTDATINGDAEPYNVLVDYCTEPNHGAGFSYLATLTGANSYQQYCKAVGLTLSPAEFTQRTAADFIGEVLRATNSEAVWTASGTLKVVPRADAAVSGNGATYTPGNGAGVGISTPIYSLDDNAYVAGPDEDPVLMTSKPAANLFNVINVEFLDRANQYNTATAQAKDDADIALNGERVAPTISLHSITQLSVARQVAQFELSKALYYPNQYEFRALPDYQLLEPMDVISITESTLGLSNTLCRVVRVEEAGDDTDELKFTVEELPLGPGTLPQYSAQAGLGYSANYSTAPGSVQAPVIFAAPPALVSNVGGYQLWLAVAGPSGSTTWGGCNVYMSLDGGTTYASIGQITSGARYGTLSAAFATGTDPDTTNTLSVTLNNTAATLTGGAQTDADNMRLLALIDSEVVSFQYCTLTAPGAYTFTSNGTSGGTKYMRRGKYGSTIAAHSSGAPFVRLDGNIFKVPLDANYAGSTIYFKFCSFNVWGSAVESLASVTAYSKTVPAIAGGVDPSNQVLSRGSIPPTVPGQSFSYTSVVTAGTVSWPAMTIYRADGTTITISAGSQSVTGLTASTVYKLYPYVVDTGASTGTISWVTGGASVGTPSIAYANGDASAAAKMYLTGNIPLYATPLTTVASGSGSGSGGGGGCLHPESMVELGGGEVLTARELHIGDYLHGPGGPIRITHLVRRQCGLWVRVSFSRNARPVTVTLDHKFIDVDGKVVRAEELKLGALLAAEGSHLYVNGLELVKEAELLVSVELEAPHLYYLGPSGPLCHNPKP